MSCGCNPRTGKCFDPEEEGPSQADLERFDSALIACPNCSADLYDEATRCPTCGFAIGIDEAPVSASARWKVGTAIVLLGALAVFAIARLI